MYNLEKNFQLLANNYGLNFEIQSFSIGEYWHYTTYSLYNRLSCFTLVCLPQREEYFCYSSKTFSTDFDKLKEHSIDIRNVEKAYWDSKEKIGCFKKPFYYRFSRNFFETLIEVINIRLSKDGNLDFNEDTIA